MNEEFCIMTDNPPYWRNFRFNGSERHEVFEGRTGNRKKSIQDGLVIFTTPELHRTGKLSLHITPKQREEKTHLKERAEKIWIEHYKKDIDDFIKEYGRNYI